MDTVTGPDLADVVNGISRSAVGEEEEPSIEYLRLPGRCDMTAGVRITRNRRLVTPERITSRRRASPEPTAVRLSGISHGVEMLRRRVGPIH